MIDLSLDSTALGSSACMLNLKRTIIGELVDGLPSPEGGYRSPLSAAVVYGISVHRFVDVMFKTNHFPTAREEAKRLFSIEKLPPNDKQGHLGDPNHLITTCYNLWTQQIECESSFEILQIPTKCWWCRGDEQQMTPCTHCQGKGIVTGPATELTFSILIYEDNFCRIFLKGTIDTVGKFKNGCFAIRDWKTTSSWKKDEYLSTYELSRQLRIYTLACKLEARNNPDSLLGKIGSTNMGSFVDAIFVKAKANENEYMRTDVFQYSKEDMETFERSLLRLCSRLSAAIQTNTFEKEGIINGSCSNIFGPDGVGGKCRFWNVCKSPEPVAQLLLKRDFKRKIFDPLTYNE